MKSIASLWRKIKLAILLVAIAGMLMPDSTSAQTGTPASSASLRFESLSLEQGLSQSVVNVTFQDSRGYLWFGTQDGLNRYDGYHFTIFRPDPDDPFSLSDRMILDIVEDAQGGLWVGTMLGGLNRYDRLSGTFTHYLHDPNNPDSLGGNCIRALEVDRDGMLWIGGDGGVDAFDPQSSSFVAHYRHEPTDPASLLPDGIIDVHHDRSGVLWVASEMGISYQAQANGRFVHLTHDPADASSLISNKVSHIYEDGQGDLWLGTELGLEHLDRQALKFEHYKSDRSTPASLSNPAVSSVLEDHQGRMWVATADGLNLLDRRSGEFTVYRHKVSDPSSLTNSMVLSLFEDREGILWVGTYGGGVNKLDPGRNKFPLLQYDASDPKNISSFGLVEDHTGQLWFAMYGQGILCVDRETGRYLLYRQNPVDPEYSLLDNFVVSVSEGLDGTIWIGSNRGLSAFNPQSGHFTHYMKNDEKPDDPYQLGGDAANFTLSDRQGRLWIAMPTGLDRFDLGTGNFTHYKHNPDDPTSLSKPNVAYIYESLAGEIWLGMFEGGLSRLDQNTGQFTHYRTDPKNPESISSDAVLAIMQDHTGTMWLGTTEGLNRFDPQTGKALHFTVKDGLPNDVIYGIVEDGEGHLWLSTNYGLSRFDPLTGDVHNYDYNDGLQSDEFNTYAFAKTRQGEIIFAGIGGTNIFMPEEIQGNDVVPPVVLTQLTQGGQPVKIEPSSNPQPQVTLHWPYNYFEFEFAALSYANPGKNQYAYYLEKFDQGWVDSGINNYGRYTNLPGGSYILHIKGANNDGLWNEAGIALPISVIPPAWQTWWFRVMAVALVLAGAFAIYRLRVRSIESYNRQLQRQVEERTHEIETLFEKTKELAIVEERNRLARDLHDSAKQKAFAALAQLGAVRSMISRESGAAQSHLNEVEDLVIEVIQELTFLIQEMYPMALKEKGLITILREYIYEWESRNDIHISLAVKHEQRLPLEVEQALYRIAQESLANIARHSRASQVSIALNYNGRTVDMEITDNGCGFSPDQKPAGVGLRTMQERATMIGGSVEISTSPSHGTRVQVRVPLQPAEAPNSSKNGGQNGQSNHNPDCG